MFILPKAIHQFYALSIKISMAFFTEIEQIILKFVWNYKKTPNIQSYLEKEEQSQAITLLDFKLYYKAILIKTVWFWHKNRHINQWHRTESPEINPQVSDQLIYNKGTKNICWGKSKGNKSKNKQVRWHQTKKLLHSKQPTKWNSNLQNRRKYLNT